AGGDHRRVGGELGDDPNIATAAFGDNPGAAVSLPKPCRSPATKKGRCRLHGGARGSGAPSGERNGQFRHGERTKAAIAERRKFSALLKMLSAGLTRIRKIECLRRHH